MTENSPMQWRNQPIGLYAMVLAGLGLFLGSSQARSRDSVPIVNKAAALYTEAPNTALSLYMEPKDEVAPTVRHHTHGPDCGHEHEHGHGDDHGDCSGHEDCDGHGHEDHGGEKPVDPERDAAF